jgi:hypothetical protein
MKHSMSWPRSIPGWVMAKAWLYQRLSAGSE